MTYGAGVVAARENGAAELVDPRPYAVGTIKATYEKYTHITNILPAMGYGDKQVRDLEETINKVPADEIIIGTPFNLSLLLKNINKPMNKVSYELDEKSVRELEKHIDKIL